MTVKACTNDWSRKTLRDIVTINYGKSPKGMLADGGAYPVIGTGGTERFGNAFLYDGESIVLGRKGTIDRVYFAAGRFWVIDTAYYLSDFVDALPRWLFYFLQNIDLRQLNEATGVPSLSRGRLYQIKVEKPPRPEQSKIAEILSTVDQAIEQTQVRIAKQQRIKTGLMQDLLTRGIDEQGNLRTEEAHEFKDSPLGRIPVEWEPSTLGRLATFYSGYAFKNKELTEHGWRVVRISNLHKRDFPFWYYDGPIKQTWVIRSGDILFSWAGVASSIDCVRYIGPEALMNQHIYNFKFASENLRNYVYYFLQSYLPILRTEIEGGAGQLHLTKAKIQSIPIPELDDNELKRVVELLDTIECRIGGQMEQLRKLRLLKTALMQDLLTGKKRVTHLLDPAEAA